jgi:hypothetical protein
MYGLGFHSELLVGRWNRDRYWAERNHLMAENSDQTSLPLGLLLAFVFRALLFG